MKTERQHLEALLPAVFRLGLRESEPLAALLDVMLALHLPAETAIETLDAFLDPRRTPDPWVETLARWVGIDFEVTTGLGRLRELIGVAVELAQQRGTKPGLLRFLETATGAAGFAIDDQVMAQDGTVRSFHIRVTIPTAAVPHLDMIEQIVIREKPAYVTYELALPDPPGGS
ncbi:phage tail protein [Haliangium sp.]|uniref:phage tail protein n=1 Tax=Haliangium sp. TaxID=2663208 RepID=UPI003D143F3E